MKQEEIKEKLMEEEQFYFDIAYSMFAELDVDKMKNNFLEIKYKGKGQKADDPMYKYIRDVIEKDKAYFEPKQKQGFQKKAVFQTEFKTSKLLVDKNLENRYEMKI